MNRIITVSREFGSGGREIGKHLAETLGYAYYDKEIVTAISERSALAESYVEQIVEHHIVTYYPITIASSFAAMPYDAVGQINRNIYAAQSEVLQEMAQKSDCVIVGRCADHILREYNPFNLFIYGDMPSRIARCRTKGGEMAEMSDKEMQRQINQIDKARARYYSSYTGQTWGDRLNYDLCINTSKRDLQMIVDSIANLIRG